eukprot:GFUD01039109.1.p1 GENE.GFUD01039109.1~~GFUD01039109.1.p1  ORF type:complete len:106 (-),score=16.68 GFUD01039109.1:115-432(-)
MCEANGLSVSGVSEISKSKCKCRSDLCQGEGNVGETGHSRLEALSKDEEYAHPGKQLRSPKLVIGDSTCDFLLPSRCPGELWSVGPCRSMDVNCTGNGSVYSSVG